MSAGLRKEETMPDARPSAVSRLLRLFTVQGPVGEETERDKDHDRVPTAGEIERKLSERDEAFFWTWQYPGQW
jgi:hypothetical protein